MLLPDLIDYQLIKDSTGHKLISSINGKSYAENLAADPIWIIGINLIIKFKREYQIDRGSLIDYLTNFEREYFTKKDKSPARDHIIQEGSKWIKQNSEPVAQ